MLIRRKDQNVCAELCLVQIISLWIDCFINCLVLNKVILQRDFLFLVKFIITYVSFPLILMCEGNTRSQVANILMYYVHIVKVEK